MSQCFSRPGFSQLETVCGAKVDLETLQGLSLVMYTTVPLHPVYSSYITRTGPFKSKHNGTRLCQNVIFALGH